MIKFLFSVLPMTSAIERLPYIMYLESDDPDSSSDEILFEPNDELWNHVADDFEPNDSITDTENYTDDRKMGG